MSVRRRWFEAFLLIYMLSGVFLIIAVVNLQAANGSYVSQRGLDYIYTVIGWMIITILFYFVAYIRLFLLFPLPIVLLAIGVIGEIVGVTLIGVRREEIDLNNRNSTVIALASVTGYLVLLQIFGIVSSIVYFRKTQNDFHSVPSK